jgi:hypothetical protein
MMAPSPPGSSSQSLPSIQLHLHLHKNPIHYPPNSGRGSSLPVQNRVFSGEGSRVRVKNPPFRFPLVDAPLNFPFICARLRRGIL